MQSIHLMSVMEIPAVKCDKHNYHMSLKARTLREKKDGIKAIPKQIDHQNNYCFKWLLGFSS